MVVVLRREGLLGLLRWGRRRARRYLQLLWCVLQLLRGRLLLGRGLLQRNGLWWRRSLLLMQRLPSLNHLSTLYVDWLGLGRCVLLSRGRNSFVRGRNLVVVGLLLRRGSKLRRRRAPIFPRRVSDRWHPLFTLTQRGRSVQLGLPRKLVEGILGHFFLCSSHGRVDIGIVLLIVAVSCKKYDGALF